MACVGGGVGGSREYMMMMIYDKIHDDDFHSLYNDYDDV
jgi:hypothetical protein